MSSYVSNSQVTKQGVIMTLPSLLHKPIAWVSEQFWCQGSPQTGKSSHSSDGDSTTALNSFKGFITLWNRCILSSVCTNFQNTRLLISLFAVVMISFISPVNIYQSWHYLLTFHDKSNILELYMFTARRICQPYNYSERKHVFHFS